MGDLSDEDPGEVEQDISMSVEKNAKHFEDRRRIMGTDGVLQIDRVVCCNDDGESPDVSPENAEIVAYLPTESESVHNGVF